MAADETVRLVAPLFKTVAVTKVVGPRGPAGPPGSVGNSEEVGNAVTTFLEENTDVILAPHINAPEPHPSYDDMPSLTLLFENGLL